jgi:hypothetical protein
MRAAVATPAPAGFSRTTLGIVTDGRASHAVAYRAAAFADSLELARFICLAGGGLYEFLFGDLIPLVTPASFLAIAVASPLCSIAYRNCFVAVDEAMNAVIGAANVFPTDLGRGCACLTAFELPASGCCG